MDSMDFKITKINEVIFIDEITKEKIFSFQYDDPLEICYLLNNKDGDENESINSL